MPRSQARRQRAAPSALLTVVLFLAAGCASEEAGSVRTSTAAATCDGGASGVEPVDTFMTLPPPSPTVAFQVTVEPGEACAGDTVRFTVRIENHTGEEIEVAPELVVTEPLPHVVLARGTLVSVGAGDERTVEVEAVVPMLEPGRYSVFVRDWTSSKATLTVRAA